MVCGKKGESHVQKEVRRPLPTLWPKKGKEGRTSERITKYSQRRPGAFDTNKKRLTCALLFCLG